MSEERPLRILHLTAGSDAGGLTRYIFDLCTAMHAQGHRVAVAGQRGAWHHLFESAPWPWIDAPLKGMPWALAKSAKILRRWLDDNPVDILHTHYRRATLVARRLQRRFNLPILYTAHLSDIPLRWPRRWLTDFGDHTHVASEDARRWIIAVGRVPPEQVTLIPHGIKTEDFPIADDAARSAARQALAVSQTDLIAAFVGRLDYPKNEDWLLDVAMKLPDLHILICGEGPHEAQLRRAIDKRRLQNRVHLFGRRSPLPVYQAADALLLPSLREGFSLVCAEAMSVGLPVLRTRTAGTTELIIENVTGRSVEIDRDAFVTRAAEFLSDRPALRRMGEGAARHVRENFIFERQLARTLALYRSMATLPDRSDT